MLLFWLQQNTRNWSEIVKALIKMRMVALAKKIAENHGEN